jgi:hypothetical protein
LIDFSKPIEYADGTPISNSVSPSDGYMGSAWVVDGNYYSAAGLALGIGRPLRNKTAPFVDPSKPMETVTGIPVTLSTQHVGDKGDFKIIFKDGDGVHRNYRYTGKYTGGYGEGSFPDIRNVSPPPSPVPTRAQLEPAVDLNKPVTHHGQAVVIHSTTGPDKLRPIIFSYTGSKQLHERAQTGFKNVPPTLTEAAQALYDAGYWELADYVPLADHKQVALWADLKAALAGKATN